MATRRKGGLETNEARQVTAASAIDQSVKSLPPMKYALAILAIAAIAGQGALLAFGARLELVVPLMIATMVLLFVFHRLTRSRSADTRLPALVMVWSVTILFSVAMATSFIAVAFGKPEPLREFLLGGQGAQQESADSDACNQENVRIETGDNSPVQNCVSIGADGDPDES